MACSTGFCSRQAIAQMGAPAAVAVAATCGMCAQDQYRLKMRGTMNPWGFKNAGAVTGAAAGAGAGYDTTWNQAYGTLDPSTGLPWAPGTAGYVDPGIASGMSATPAPGTVAPSNIYNVAGQLIAAAGTIITTQQANDAAAAARQATADATAAAIANARYSNNGLLPTQTRMGTPPTSSYGTSGGGTSMILLGALGIAAAVLSGAVKLK